MVPIAGARGLTKHTHNLKQNQLASAMTHLQDARCMHNSGELNAAAVRPGCQARHVCNHPCVALDHRDGDAAATCPLQQGANSTTNSAHASGAAQQDSMSRGCWLVPTGLRRGRDKLASKQGPQSS